MIKEVKLDQVFNLAGVNAAEFQAFEIPTGSIISWAGLIVKSDIQKTSDKMTRIGLKTDTAPPIGATPALTRNSKFCALMPSTVVQQTTKLLICGLQDDGVILVDLNVTAGQVRVVVSYLVLTPLEDF